MKFFKRNEVATVAVQFGDFNPATSHMHSCDKEWASTEACNKNCINELWALADEMNRQLRTE